MHDSICQVAMPSDGGSVIITRSVGPMAIAFCDVIQHVAARDDPFRLGVMLLFISYLQSLGGYFNFWQFCFFSSLCMLGGMSGKAVLAASGEGNC